ncbi:YadA-like family protein [Fusobacterium nucleatum]|uniref:YadA-like family protein n=1 Tax=Fusobacterium nucleatum TaxID=851 RepID=UPI0030CFF86B
MKKSISLKLIVFSFLLVVSNLTYSTPVFQAGTGTNSTVAGVNNIATGDRSSAVGFFNTADGKDSLAMGYHNETKKVSSTAVGVENKANAENSLAVGFSNTVSGNSSSTFGVENIVTGNYSTAVGYKNKVSDNGSYAFGNDNTINGDNNFVLGNNVNIGAGIQNSVALGNNSTVSSSNEVSVGSKGKERKITNVADGEVSATSTDAVTGKQLYKAMQNSGAASIENLKSEVYEKIDNVKDEVRGVGSLSAALAGLHPMQYDPKAPAQVMAALGHYKNKQAIAVGASYYFNDRFMMSTGIALSGEKKTKTMANVGFTLKLGKGSGVSYNETPLYTIQDEVKRLTLENNKQAKENQELKAKVELQGVENQELKERVKNLEEKLNKLLKNK